MARVLFTLLCSLLLLSSCQEGRGGKQDLTGMVMAQEFDVFGDLLREYPAVEERVYIIYGDNELYDDDSRTHSDGRYQFRYLRSGNYRVYAYEDCGACPGEKRAVEVSVDLQSDNSEVPTIYLNKE